jgi:hypothetical protein
MGFLKRMGGGKGKVPDWAEFMEPDEYAAFRRLADDWLRTNVGPFREIDGGGVEVPPSQGGEPMTIGLTNLAQKCHAIPRSEWAAQIDGHLGSLFRNPSPKQDPVFEEVRSQIKVRVFPEDALPPDARAVLITRPVAPGLLAALAIDYPETVVSLNPDMPAKWGRTPDELFELGLANVRVQDQPDIDLLQDTSIRLLSGESFFVATWVLMLEERMQPVSPHGALVVVPTRHAILFQPIVDAGVVKSIGPLLGVADAECRQGPGSISPNLYWWKDGHLTLLPARLEGRKVDFVPPDEFVAMLNSLPPGQ